MKVINGYVIDGDLKTDNSGFSKWAFAKKNGCDYFYQGVSGAGLSGR